MGLNLNSYKTVGSIYEIGPPDATRKGFPKRYFILEVPVSPNNRDKTTFMKFTVLGDQCGSLDFYEVADYLEVLFSVEGYWWTRPEDGEKVLLQSLKPIDMHKRDNPFETKEKVLDSPNDLSPDPIAELAKNVKDYSREASQDTLPFDPIEEDGLPF